MTPPDRLPVRRGTGLDGADRARSRRAGQTVRDDVVGPRATLSRVMKRILAALALVAGYVVISSLCHYVFFPEPGPDPSDLPRRGTTVVNAGIRSTFVYRQTSIETAGRLFEW